MTAATEVVPYLIDCSVSVQPAHRTLIVKPVAVGGSGGLAWRESWRGLLAAEQSGWADALTIPKAFFAGLELKSVYVAADPLWPGLKFTFKIGDQDYENLVYRKGLYAVATVDLSSHRFTAVRFRHRGDGSAVSDDTVASRSRTEIEQGIRTSPRGDERWEWNTTSRRRQDVPWLQARNP